MNYNFKSVLFLGVGGVSMHQLAISLKKLGVNVLGYDAKISEYTKQCEECGINISNKFNRNFLNVDLCVKTGAIKENNRWVKALKKLNVPIIDRAELLGWLASKFKCVIAVAGTHGKSTTASLIYEILRVAGKKVSCHIGADVFASRFDLGDEYLVVEACEYNKSFLSLYPNIAVVTNIEPEHMDCYGSFYNLKNAFLTFIKRANKRFVMEEKSTEFLKKQKNIIRVQANENLHSKLKGEYNAKNISLSIAVAKELGIDEEIINKVVSSFKGVPRRYEHIGSCGKTKVYIDYAHHPTEINVFISTFRKEYPNSLIVFQPHTFSRTKNLFYEFVSVFCGLSNLVIFKEYPAREKSVLGKSAYELFKSLAIYDINVRYAKNINQISKLIQCFDAVAFVGAGDINKVAEKIVERNL